MGEVVAKVHIFASKAQGSGRVARLTLDVFISERISLLIFQEAEYAPGPVLMRRSKEKSPSGPSSPKPYC